MDKKTFRAIMRDDYRTMARMQLIIGKLKYGFSVFPDKHGFATKKEVSKYCLKEFVVKTATLDQAISFMEGYILALEVPGSSTGGDDDEGDENLPQPKPPTVH